MSETTPSAVSPYLRSCKQESDVPIEGQLQGEIPKWLKGNLIRNGPGLMEIGSDHFNHVFDGMALLHKFSFEEGVVRYQSRFLRSDAYRKNTEANRIVVSEFGTRAPDPCRTIFQRFSSLFQQGEEPSDNDLVNVVLYTDEAYACTESHAIWRIEPDTLESIQRVKLNRYVPIHAATAHPHEGKDGTVYNVGSVYGYKSSYRFIKFEPKEKPTDSAFEKGSLICSIPSSMSFGLSYHHSFGMTENYFVFVEQPLYLNILRLSYMKFTSGNFSDSLKYDKNEPCRFYIVRRSDGHLMETKYVSQSFFVFHHINAYEEDGHLVVDMCTYADGGVVSSLYVKALEEAAKNEKNFHLPFASQASRFVLPLSVDASKKGDENLVHLKNSKATACLQTDGSVFLKSEILTEDAWAPELPRIHYEKFNGEKYKYFYSMAKNRTLEGTHLIKVDVSTTETTSWHEEGVMPSEPVFIPNPQSESGDEDSGVILASLLYVEDETKVSILVLDARNMKEVGRVTFHTKSSVPGDFHGIFILKE